MPMIDPPVTDNTDLQTFFDALDDLTSEIAALGQMLQASLTCMARFDSSFLEDARPGFLEVARQIAQKATELHCKGAIARTRA